MIFQIEDETQPVAAAFEDASRVLRADTFVSRFLHTGPEGAYENVVTYLAECLLARRPVTPTYALNFLGYWEQFRESFFRLLAEEETVLSESAGEGVYIPADDLTRFTQCAAGIGSLILAA